MKRSTRVLILLVVFEALTIGIGLYSIMQIRSGAWDGGSQSAELVKRIGEVVGMLVPLLACIFLALFFMVRSAERRALKTGGN